MLDWNVAELSTMVTYYPWLWPAAETLHYIGMALLIGVVLIVNLRMFGMWKTVSFADLHLLLPFGIIAIVINFLTGMLFFIGTPGQYTQNTSFHWKIIFLLPAAGSLLYLTISERVWALGPGDEAPVTAKVIAVSSIVLWFGVLYFGRMLPYIGNSF
jgi:hypothetical protein